MKLKILNTLGFAVAVIETEDGIMFRTEENGFNLHTPAVVEELNEIVENSNISSSFHGWDSISEEELDEHSETSTEYTVQEWLEYLER